MSLLQHWHWFLIIPTMLFIPNTLLAIRGSELCPFHLCIHKMWHSSTHCVHSQNICLLKYLVNTYILHQTLGKLFNKGDKAPALREFTVLWMKEWMNTRTMSIEDTAPYWYLLKINFCTSWRFWYTTLPMIITKL